LPDGHVDKVKEKPMETKVEYKVGDWVVVTSLKLNNHNSVYSIGLVAQISAYKFHKQSYNYVSKNWWNWLELNGKVLSNNAICDSSLRPATKEEIDSVTKVKEVIPEYVQLIKDWSVDREYMNEVFCLNELNNLHKFENAPTKEVFRKKINNWIKEGYFKVITKQAYDDQLYNLKQQEHFETEVDMNSLLEIAKKKYPIGTKFIDIKNEGIIKWIIKTIINN